MKERKKQVAWKGLLACYGMQQLVHSLAAQARKWLKCTNEEKGGHSENEK
jgi:hypothetical protein